MKDSGTPIINPYLAVFVAVLAVSFSSIITKLSTAPPLVIAFYRLLFTVILLLPWVFNRKGREEMAIIQAKDFFAAVLSGAFLALHFAAWITSLSYTSISSSTVLVAMQPLFVIAGSALFLGEKIQRIALVGAAMTIIGSMFIGFTDFQVGGMALYGDFLAFTGAIFVAVYVLIGRSLRAKLSLFTYVFIVYTASVVLLLLVNLISGESLYPYSPKDWLCFVGLAIIPTILGHTVLNWSLKYVPASVVSVSILGEPLGASVMAYFIFEQSLVPFQVVGSVIIIAGLYIFIKFSQSQNNPVKK